MKTKKKIAVLFGGCSSEYGASLQSACAVITHLDGAKYEAVMIGITRDGEWFRFYGQPGGGDPDAAVEALAFHRSSRIYLKNNG